MSASNPIIIPDSLTLAIDIGIVNFAWVLFNPNYQKVIDFGLEEFANAKNGKIMLAREIQVLMDRLTKHHKDIVIVVEKQTGRIIFKTSGTIQSIEMGVIMYCVNNDIAVVSVFPTTIQSYFKLKINNRKAKKMEAIELALPYLTIDELAEKWESVRKHDDIADALLLALYYNKE